MTCKITKLAIIYWSRFSIFATVCTELLVTGTLPFLFLFHLPLTFPFFCCFPLLFLLPFPPPRLFPFLLLPFLPLFVLHFTLPIPFSFPSYSPDFYYSLAHVPFSVILFLSPSSSLSLLFTFYFLSLFLFPFLSYPP